jgi:prophage regulatory protein
MRRVGLAQWSGGKMQSLGIDNSNVSLVLPVILRELQQRGEQKVAHMLSEALHSSGATEPPVGKRLIREKKVRAKVPWSRTTLWRKVKSGEFPAPVRLSNGMTAWLEETVDAWIDARVAEAVD